MKIKKQFVPVLLVLLFALSVFYRISNLMETAAAYRSYLAEGSRFAESGVTADAIASYTKALEMKKDIDTSLKIGNLYCATEDYYAAYNWYEDDLLVNYPEDPRTYEFGINSSLQAGDYSSAFACYNEFQNRGLTSESVEAMIDTIRYEYTLSGGFEEVAPFSYASNTAAVKDENGWNYIDQFGSTSIRGDFQTAGVFSQYAAVTDKEGNLCFIDTDGEIRITPQMITEKDPDFGAVKQFQTIQSGLILASNGSVWNYYDQTDCTKRFGGYQDATVVANGVGAVCDEHEKWALIDADGNELTAFEFDDVAADEKGIICRGNAIIVEKDGGYHLIDRSGNPISENTYQMAYAFNDNSLAAVQKNEKWIFVDDAGTEYDLGSFEDVRSFSSGAAAVMRSGKWGYIDLKGEVVIDCQFYEAEPFHKTGTAFVKDDKNTWTMLSLKSGRIG